MPTPILGAGACPAGRSPYGFGMPATTEVPLRPTLGTGRRIDPSTGDYVLDAHGMHLMMPTTQQLVLLALKTQLGSSIEYDKGIAPFPPVINDNTLAEVEQIIRDALDFLVKDKKLEIVSIVVERIGLTGVLARTQFRDLTTGLEQSFELNL